MRSRKIWISTLFFAIVGFVALPSFAGTKLAFQNGIQKTVFSGCRFTKCASVQIVPPANGFVVVTASGMGSFSHDLSFLELTLGTRPARKGPWFYRVTPGFRLFQNYSVQRVFRVVSDGTTVYNFYLNGRLCGGPVGEVSVETGSITAEFFPASDVERFSEPQLQGVDDSTSTQVNKP